MLKDFLSEAREHLDQLNLNLIQLEQAPEEETLIDEIFRTVHTLKGSASLFSAKSTTRSVRSGSRLSQRQMELESISE